MIQPTEKARLTRAAGPRCSSCRMLPAVTQIRRRDGQLQWRCQSCAARKTVSRWSGRAR
jgi:hypothetical protein